MPEYVQRTIHTPPWEWGTADQAASFLGLDAEEVLHRLKVGAFPLGGARGARRPQWAWHVILGVSLTRDWWDRLYARRKKSLRKVKANRKLEKDDPADP